MCNLLLLLKKLPMAPEESGKFNPVDEHSGSNQPEDQLPKVVQEELTDMEQIQSPFSSEFAEYENSHHRCEATPPMVKIPYRMMLDVLLETLELPAAEYRSRVCDNNRVCVTVFFHTSASYAEDQGSRMAIPGVQCVNHAMSEDTAAMEAIGYIKSMAKTEIRDYNYSTMKKLDEENQSLKHELALTKYNTKKMKARTRSIKNKLMIANYKKKKNAMGWFFLARYMHGFSNHICNVTALNRSSRRGLIDQLMNEPLNNIEKVAERLKRRVLKSEKHLRSIRRGF